MVWIRPSIIVGENKTTLLNWKIYIIIFSFIAEVREWKGYIKLNYQVQREHYEMYL